ncbi:MAG TPA: ABC transporter ATP-binding protein, partial [Candidatus Binataceae bacterium]|nr:ABC transporter ATP-binding protein [Candidatus Binataceae bacterium]
MSPVIEIVDLSKTYTLGEIKVEALRGVSLRIERGEFVAIMGASGSGKSTLMNIVGCLDRPTSGRYLLQGVDVASLSEEDLAAIRSRRIGFIFQNFNLLSRTSALENVELPLFYSGWESGGEARAKALLEMVGLSGRFANHPNQLSGGQQQRVAIARALINNPAILLADEPTGNLDSTNSTEIMEIIKGLNREGLTVVLVTHDQEVADYVDRIITFRDGMVISDRRKAGGESAVTAPIASAAPALGPSGVNHESKPVRSDPLTFAHMALSAAGRALRRNKLRAALTMLGIFIGVA